MLRHFIKCLKLKKRLIILINSITRDWPTACEIGTLDIHTLQDNQQPAEKGAFKIIVVFTNWTYLGSQCDTQLREIHLGLS